MRFHDSAAAAQHADLMVALVEEMRTMYEWDAVPCVVCGRDDAEPFLRKFEIDMVRCRDCGHLYVSPRLPESAVPHLYGSRYWDDYTRAIGSPTIDERADFDHQTGFYKLQRDVFPHRAGGRLCDVGASNGGMVRAAAERGFDAVGVEPSAEIAARARELSGADVRAGTLAEQRFPDASFDVVTLHDVIEHVFEPFEVLRECRRVLAAGGLLVLETPTASSLHAADRGVDWSTYSPLEHVHLFDEGNLVRLVQRAGFRLVDVYCPHEDNVIVIAEVAE